MIKYIYVKSNQLITNLLIRVSSHPEVASSTGCQTRWGARGGWVPRVPWTPRVESTSDLLLAITKKLLKG